MHLSTVTFGGQNRVANSLKMMLQALVSCPVWVFETELRSFGKGQQLSHLYSPKPVAQVDLKLMILLPLPLQHVLLDWYTPPQAAHAAFLVTTFIGI